MNTLTPLGWLYGLGTDLRGLLYERGILKSHQLGRRTISIGNITTGGTGKTPLVALVSRLLFESGERVCVLTRGYGREHASRRILVSDGEHVFADARTGGDEPVELAFKLIGKCSVIADRDRVSAADWAVRELSSTVFVLDDGFQHRRARRDLDLVCIDATNPFGNRELLPAGTLREKRSGLARADVVVITRTDLAGDATEMIAEIKELAPNAKVFTSSNKIVRISEIAAFLDEKREPSSFGPVISTTAFAFCGLGNPLNFFRQLEVNGSSIVSRKAFPDHYYYTSKDIANLEKRAQTAGAEVLITTAKDAVRLANLEISMPCYVAEIETVVTNDAAFREIICPS